jgi:hypothetical protein
LLAAGPQIADACNPPPCQDATSLTITDPAEGTKGTFSSATPGTLGPIECKAAAVPECNNPDITWSCEEKAPETQKIWDPDPPKGAAVYLTLSGLPNDNSALGNGWIGASVDAQSDTSTGKIFFPEEATRR